MKRIRKFLIRLLQDSEDELDDGVIPMPDPDSRPSMAKIQNNHLYHLTMGHNNLSIRVGRIDAKVGLLLALVFGIFSLAAKPLLEAWLGGLF